MAHINTQKNIELGRKIKNHYYDMAYNNAIELIEEYGADSYRLVGAGFNFGFAQGYKQAKAEERQVKGVSA